MVFRASWDDPVGLEAATRRIGLGAAGKCTIFNVVTNPVVDRPVGTNVPAILDIQPVNIVERVDEAGTRRDRKRCRSGGTSEAFPLSEMKLLEERVVRKVADIKPGLNGVRAVGPGETIQVLKPVLQPTLRATEGCAMVEVRSPLTGQRRKVQGGSQEPVPEEASLVHRVRRWSGDHGHVQIVIVDRDVVQDFWCGMNGRKLNRRVAF